MRKQAAKKAAKLAAIPDFEPSSTPFPWRQYNPKLVYFTGGGVPTESIPYPSLSVQFPVVDHLTVIDPTEEGAKMKDVFTLVPRKSTQDWIKEEYLEALEHVKANGNNNRRNSVSKKSVSESGNQIYNCYGMHANRYGGGVEENTSHGNFDIEHRKNIGRWTKAVEALVSEFLPTEVLSAFTGTRAEVLIYRRIPLHLWRETNPRRRSRKPAARQNLFAAFMTGLAGGLDNMLNVHVDKDGFYSVACVVRKDRNSGHDPNAVAMTPMM